MLSLPVSTKQQCAIWDNPPPVKIKATLLMEVCDLGHSSSLFTCSHSDKKLAVDSGAFKKFYQD